MKEIILNIFSLILLTVCPQIALAIIPEKNIYYPTNPRNKELYKQLSEADLNEVADRIIKVYYEFTNIHYKAKIVFNKDWSNDQVSAFATQPNDNEFHITVAGGIVRAPGMTKDALALVLCHELGHHLGGAPRTALYNGWPSAEGQADYFATAKCLKKYFYEIKNEEIDISSNIPEKVISDCNSVYTNFIDMKICTRSILASLDFANFLNQLPTTKIPIKLETPDTRIVKGTNINNYPRPQCRFDTLYAGALCSLSADLRSSIDDPGTGYCMDETRPGTRPHCWYYK
jgi:hypothetical protein